MSTTDDAKNLRNKIEHCNKWVADEQYAFKEMERRHDRERQEQQMLLNRAADALSFARGYQNALEHLAVESALELAARARSAGVDPVIYASEYRSASAAYGEIG